MARGSPVIEAAGKGTGPTGMEHGPLLLPLLCWLQQLRPQPHQVPSAGHQHGAGPPQGLHPGVLPDLGAQPDCSGLPWALMLPLACI